MIELRAVRKVFNEGKANEFQALNGIDLHVAAERVTVLRGPSGSGKTTLLTIAGCLARPTGGRVRFDGRDISNLPERFLTEIRRSTFGFVFQRFNLIRGLTALENVMLPAYPLGLNYPALREKAAALLASLQLSQRLAARVEELSGGEAQRVAIARALINDPLIIIADEPTANLDTALARQFLTILERLRAQGRTLLLASHDPLIYESSLVDTVVQMRDGRVVETD